MAAEHTYRVSAWWSSGRTGLAKCESSPNVIHFSQAAELGGLEGRWTPEQMLLCALASSFITTFSDLARSAEFAYTDLEVAVEGSVRRDRAKGCTLHEIRFAPALTVVSENQCEAGLVLLRHTKAACMISRALGVPQILDPSVEACKASAASWSLSEAELEAQV
jgi:organic hydroperoxide reductase OsmC/OhrA